MRFILRFLILTGLPTVFHLCGAEFQVSTNTVRDQERVALTQLTNGTIVIAWEDEASGLSEIWCRRYDTNLNSLGAPFRAHGITPQDQAEPAIAALRNGSFVVAWSSRGVDGSDYGVVFRRFDGNGNPLDAGPQSVNTATTGGQLRPDVAALTTGGFVIVWSDQSGADQDVRYRRFDANGGAMDPTDLVANGWGTDARIAGDQGNARVAPLTNGGFVVVYEDRLSDDLFAVRFDAAGNALPSQPPASGPRQLRVNQEVAFEQGRPAVSSFTNGSFVVVFNSETNGGPSSRRVLARYFNPAGVGAAEIVLGSFTNRTQDAQVAALANGTFVAVMQARDVGRDAGSNAWSVLAQRAGTNGLMYTASFIAHNYQTDDQERPAVAALRDGSYLVAWQSFGQDTNRYGVFAQQFTRSGEPAGGTLFIARSVPAGVNFVVTLTNGTPFVPYRLQAATNLANWTTIHATNTSNGVFQYLEAQGAANRSRSYRVVTP